jgi:hypothetical protein
MINILCHCAAVQIFLHPSFLLHSTHTHTHTVHPLSSCTHPPIATLHSPPSLLCTNTSPPPSHAPVVTRHTHTPPRHSAHTPPHPSPPGTHIFTASLHTLSPRHHAHAHHSPPYALSAPVQIVLHTLIVASRVGLGNTPPPGPVLQAT